MDSETLAALIQGGATLLAALIVGVAGGMISRRYARERDRQDKESQWRQHAIELAKLDLERKLRTRGPDDPSPTRPSVLDFLANYRDLPVQVEVRRNFPTAAWELETDGDAGAYTRQDRDTAQFTLDLHPGERREFRYTVVLRHGSRAL